MTTPKSRYRPPGAVKYANSLAVVPVTLREANAFVEKHHRHHDKVRGHKLSTGIIDQDGELRGVAILARPLARMIDHTQVAEVTRVATDGCPNACSMLLGVCCRLGKTLGFAYVITYTLFEESGVSLRAAGYKPVALTSGGAWSRTGREREDDQPLGRKVRWECAHGPSEAIDLSEAA